jgi:glycosyltransferase involved in cell wall biosynthesis
MNYHNSDDNITVSICCLTYNHEKYICQTIESFLFQKTNFLFEIVIHDDASTDNTAKIITDYASKHPNLFNVSIQKENQRSKLNSGGMNPRFNYPRAKGKYIAICEGDDYWTDPYKLQKQVDFLETNSNYAACYTEASKVDDKDNLLSENICLYKRDLNQKDIFSVGGWYANASLLFRNHKNIIKAYQVIKPINGGDRLLATTLTDNDNLIGYLPDSTCNYRVHLGGIYSKKSKYVKYKKVYQDFL